MPTIVPIPEMLPDDMCCATVVRLSGNCDSTSSIGEDIFSLDSERSYLDIPAFLRRADDPIRVRTFAELATAITPDMTRAVFDDIHRLLRKILLGPTAADTTLSAVLEKLTDERRPTARALLRAVGIEQIGRAHV